MVVKPEDAVVFVHMLRISRVGYWRQEGLDLLYVIKRKEREYIIIISSASFMGETTNKRWVPIQNNFLQEFHRMNYTKTFNHHLSRKVTPKSVMYIFSTLLLDLFSGKHNSPSHVCAISTHDILTYIHKTI
ncbi:uncharacterized protein LOC110869211 isoform X2 [Helianthus annuus]|uniref:uncharacterized protein LOC110869211 isoform X2 n=1 Tax=Helianthus annuus TaxID=4232 RepID=UPI00165307E1|nr:uncharacterized protein LOC110869211 isoform X2 [Helianthus annuus]